jgi:hypothetical protein
MAETAILKIENMLQRLNQLTNFHKILRDCCFCEVKVSPALNLVNLLKSKMVAAAILETVSLL